MQPAVFGLLSLPNLPVPRLPLLSFARLCVHVTPAADLPILGSHTVSNTLVLVSDGRNCETENTLGKRERERER